MEHKIPNVSLRVTPRDHDVRYQKKKSSLRTADAGLFEGWLKAYLSTKYYVQRQPGYSYFEDWLN